ncbi:hypothetical protein KIN20_015508 [Parelaphostrongylus tenuis]|uniref:Uncharacterized protein n=1 Tax=Parelaphostrongylus tenuis TaxID=148309 RepID=A0AAD5QP28_PARTN|nr:hypothetical protein KIN20_015508 [Parelaphostrongylus tenuis]
MKTHGHANDFVKELDENGEFIDQRKNNEKKSKNLNLWIISNAGETLDKGIVPIFVRFEAITSGTPLELARPQADDVDKVPLYAAWILEVVRYAEIERKRMTQLRPINNVGRCRAARSEMIRDFAIPCKRRRRDRQSIVGVCLT